MPAYVRKTADEFLAEIEKVERQRGRKSIEYFKAVKEFQKFVHGLVAVHA